jgi:hypothetical protein
VGPDSNSLWDVTDSNAGAVNGVSFANFQNLTGGAGDDLVTFADGKSVSGVIDGGGGRNTLDFSGYTTAVNVNLQTGATNAGGLGGVVHFQDVFGGAGDDVLVGSAAGGILVGNAGDDTITAGSGRSVVIGGTGNDALAAGAGGAILIQGTTAYDASVPALQSVLAEWQSGNDYATRVAHLRTGTGLADGHALIWGATVLDDNGSNTLTGNPAASGDEFDWFFADLDPGHDIINNLLPGEEVN